MTHAVFYCENCRKPVPLESIECPHCGSRFTAVQCPRCSFVGEARLFSGGCPQCGFLAPVEGGRPVVKGKPAPDLPASRRADAAGTRMRAGAAGRETRSGGLPGWFYVLAAILLALVVLALGYILFKLK